MTGVRRRAIEQQNATAERHYTLWALGVLASVGLLAGLYGVLREAPTAWPRPMAFGWGAVFSFGFVAEWLRQRAARRRAAVIRAVVGRPGNRATPQG